MAYTGTERRRRVVYVTKNSEYHAKDGVCVAIRDKRSGRWLARHSALAKRIDGGVRTYSNGCVLPTMEPPAVGDPMYFVLGHGEDDVQLVTSRIEAIARPPREIVAQYAR